MEIAIIVAVVLLVVATIFRGAAGGAISCLGGIFLFGFGLMLVGFMARFLWAFSPVAFWIAMVLIGFCLAGVIYLAISDYRKTKRGKRANQIDTKAAPTLKQLFKQATLIEPRIHQHPDGTYLLVKEDGSLSAFRSLERARLQRDDPSRFMPKPTDTAVSISLQKE